MHPHPDDESIACGGVLARYAAEDVHVHVVVCTGGEEGENLAGIDLGDEDIPSHRRRELADALATLGVSGHTALGYRDSGMAGSDANQHPDSFHQADLEEAAVVLAAVLRDVRPQVVISDDARGTYGHPDHIKAHRVTVRAVELAADPDGPLEGEPWQVAKRYVHAIDRDRMLATHRELLRRGLDSPFAEGRIDSPEELELGVPPEQISARIRVGDYLTVKQAAMRAHRTQLGDESFFLNLPRDMASELFGVEDFVLEAVDVAQLAADQTPAVRDREPAMAAGEREDDLFAGVRAHPGPPRPSPARAFDEHP